MAPVVVVERVKVDGSTAADESSARECTCDLAEPDSYTQDSASHGS